MPSAHGGATRGLHPQEKAVLSRRTPGHCILIDAHDPCTRFVGPRSRNFSYRNPVADCDLHFGAIQVAVACGGKPELSSVVVEFFRRNLRPSKRIVSMRRPCSEGALIAACDSPLRISLGDRSEPALLSLRFYSLDSMSYLYHGSEPK